jgi:hypothetical protein
VIGEVSHVLQHPTQAAELLGIAVPRELEDAARVAWDVDTLMAAWLELVRSTPWDVLNSPLAVLGRTPLALAVDAAVGISALRAGLQSGWFPWPGNPVTGETGDAAVVAYEASIVAAIAQGDHLLAFVEPVAAAWHDYAFEQADAQAADPGREIGAPRGTLTALALLEAQRLHCAQHYRQAITQVASLGHATPELDFGAMYGLQLPASVV